MHQYIKENLEDVASYSKNENYLTKRTLQKNCKTLQRATGVNSLQSILQSHCGLTMEDNGCIFNTKQNVKIGEVDLCVHYNIVMFPTLLSILGKVGPVKR